MFMLDAQTHNSLKCYENVKCNLITLKILWAIRKSIQNKKKITAFISLLYTYGNPIDIIIIVSFSVAAMDPKNQSKLGNPSQYDDKYGLCW